VENKHARIYVDVNIGLFGMNQFFQITKHYVWKHVFQNCMVTVFFLELINNVFHYIIFFVSLNASLNNEINIFSRAVIIWPMHAYHGLVITDNLQ